MKPKKVVSVPKRDSTRTTSTRNAVETAIDLAKEGRPWLSGERIKPWTPPARVDPKQPTDEPAVTR